MLSGNIEGFIDSGRRDLLFVPVGITYERLVEVFWRNADPADGGGQFCDRGSQYRTGIFYEDEAQKRAADQTAVA